MLGNSLLNSSTVDLKTKEVADQYDAVNEAGKKLAQLSKMDWCMTSSRLFDKVRKVSFAEGVIIGVIGSALGFVVYKVVDKTIDKKQNQEEHTEE